MILGKILITFKASSREFFPSISRNILDESIPRTINSCLIFQPSLSSNEIPPTAGCVTKIFASGNLNEDEMIIYSKLFNILNDSLPKPDLFVYLHQSPENLLLNIKKRGRSYEQNISIDYLSKIERNYFTFFEQSQNLKIVIIDVNNINFIDNSAIYQQFIAIINQQYNYGVSHRTIEINR